MEKEIETRAVVPNRDALIEALRRLGFVEDYSRTQTDITLDDPDGSLFRSGRKIRLRIEGDSAELTYKGSSEGDNSFSRRNEINLKIGIDLVPGFKDFFEAIGFPALFTVTKHRTCLVGPGLKVTFDDWPIIGCVMELEGSEAQAKQLTEKILPGVEFKHYRLKELFETAAKQAGVSVYDLQRSYESKHQVKLGRLDLLLK